MSKLEKDKIRRLLLEKRKQLSKEEIKLKSELIIKNIKHSGIISKADNIAFYHAVRGEADPSLLMTNNTNHKQFYLPLLSPNKNQGLIFAKVSKDTIYNNNEFSIPEPVITPSDIIEPELFDVVIMPLLGFDLKGNRLGMGGGYYDRRFSFKQSKPNKPILVGFAYDFQQTTPLVAEAWDIGLDAIATETRFINFNY